jgi:hypothetical protein
VVEKEKVKALKKNNYKYRNPLKVYAALNFKFWS